LPNKKKRSVALKSNNGIKNPNIVRDSKPPRFVFITHTESLKLENQIEKIEEEDVWRT